MFFLSLDCKWDCSQCTYRNYPRTVRCAQCYSLREMDKSTVAGQHLASKATQSPTSKASLCSKLAHSPGHKSRQSPPLKYRQSPPLKSRQSPPLKSRQSPPLKFYHQSSPKGRRSPPRQIIGMKPGVSRSQASPKGSTSSSCNAIVNNRVNHETQTGLVTDTVVTSQSLCGASVTGEPSDELGGGSALNRQQHSTTGIKQQSNTSSNQQQSTTSSNQQSTINSNQHKWCCIACTYENWPRSARCIMCATPKNKLETNETGKRRQPCSSPGSDSSDTAAVPLADYYPLTSAANNAPPQPPPLPPSPSSTKSATFSQTFPTPLRADMSKAQHNDEDLCSKSSAACNYRQSTNSSNLTEDVNVTAAGEQPSITCESINQINKRSSEEYIRIPIDDNERSAAAIVSNVSNAVNSNSLASCTAMNTVTSATQHHRTCVSSTCSILSSSCITVAAASPSPLISCCTQQANTNSQHNHLNSGHGGESGVRGRSNEGAMALNVSNLDYISNNNITMTFSLHQGGVVMSSQITHTQSSTYNTHNRQHNHTIINIFNSPLSPYT